MKTSASKIAPILLMFALAFGSFAGASFVDWSKTAATNATADSSVNWSEGMAPSSVNDSARAMMARLAEYRDDTSGLLATTGTSTAYLVTTNQGLAATPANGQLLAITMNATNGAAPTLAADGGTAFPIQTAPGVAVSSGVLVSGTPYTLKFLTASSAWILRNFYGSPFIVPVGAMLPYTGSTAPNSNFVLPAGQCISRTTYAVYFALVATAFGACDGSTTFGVPDMRGRVIAAIDNLGGSAASRLSTTYFGTDPTVIGNAGGAQSKALSIAELAAHSHGVNDPTHSHGVPGQTGTGTFQAGARFNNGANGGFIDNYVPTTAVATGITIQNTGSGTAFAIVQPTIALSYILRIN